MKQVYESVTAQFIFNSIDSVLKEMGKCWTSVLAVCFDGASTMSGSSLMRHATLMKIGQETNVKLMTIKSYSTTRWTCRAEVVKVIINNYDSLLFAIEEINDNCTNPEISEKSKSLLYQIIRFEFIFGMFMMHPILNLILKVSSVLQSPKLNLLLGIDNVRSLTSNLKNMRNENKEFKNIFDQAVTLCKNHEIIVPAVIRRKVSTQIDKQSKSQFFFENKLDEMKISVYYELLDDLLWAMDSRFNQETLSLIEAIASLLRMEIKSEMIDVLAKFSNTLSTDLKTEINLLKHLPKPDKPNSISSESIYLGLNWLKTNNSISTYSCFYKTLQLFTVILVTSCTCETVFSKMTIIKTKLRNTMKQERLDSLLLLFTEQELTSGVDGFCH
ncbi:zinc finger MYM-type protein 1-like [Aphis craccivora]|uniref:Zinc finger MYM-type protein 1-like n=1 Tax=Aphis craccivora TaxID=307492 RepID=A0A6G0VYG6_APHCR|nr:zinc finger MYM-type protein 1-like [Aphis craccivora]